MVTVYCVLKVLSCAIILLFMCFYNLMLCHRKWGFVVKLKFSLISHSVSVKISRKFILILFIKSFIMFTCLFIHAKLCHRKRVLNVFYLRFCFLDSQIKHFSVFLRLFKIYVVDQKPQTIISSFPIYTKLL